ncbi:MAG: NifU family protein [Erysipelotrichaceae bacterium]|nr:NifU family protein [Erysipelotrichaceae bacterium]
MEKQEKINLILKSIEKVRPYLQRDGGDVEFVELTDDNIVYVKVYGACVGCLMLDQTLKDGVMSIIMDEVPEIADVRLAEIEPK